MSPRRSDSEQAVKRRMKERSLWRATFRLGVAPEMEAPHLEKLAQYLAPGANDGTLVMGWTSLPFKGEPDGSHVGTAPTGEQRGHPALCGCAMSVGYVDGERTLAAVDTEFVKLTGRVEARLRGLSDEEITGEFPDFDPASVRTNGACPFLSWFDRGPAALTFPQLLSEVELELARRKADSQGVKPCSVVDG